MIPPLQIILLALVVGFFGQVEWVGRTALLPWQVLMVVGVGYGGLVWAVWQRAARVCKRLHATSEDAVKLTAPVEQFVDAARWATLVLAAGMIGYMGWGDLVLRKWGLGDQVLMSALVFMMPVLLAWVGFWVASYQVERAVRERSLPFRMARGLPAHEMPTLGQYLSMQVRHNLVLLLPIWLALGAEDLVERVPGVGKSEWWESLLGLALLVPMVLFVPWLLTRVWSTVPMPMGALRARLDKMAKRFGLRYRDVLVWKTHNAVTNAAVMGFIPAARYFLMTDALLESLTDRQIEAVFAHEVGHGKHRHIWWYLAFMVGMGAVAAGLPEAMAALYPSLGRQVAFMNGLQFVILGLGWVWGFSKVSRRFEHQADWFAAKYMGESLEAEPEYLADAITIDQYLKQVVPPPPAAAPGSPTAAADANAPIGGVGVATTMEFAGGAAAGKGGERQKLAKGAAMFASALGEVVNMNHKSSEKAGWLHPSPRYRIKLIQELAASAEEERKFEQVMVTTRLWVVAMVVLGVGLGVGAGFLRPVEKGPERIHTGEGVLAREGTREIRIEF